MCSFLDTAPSELFGDAPLKIRAVHYVVTICDYGSQSIELEHYI